MIDAGTYSNHDLSSHVVTDFAIGLEWRSKNVCAWDFGVRVGWEHHLFFNMKHFSEPGVLISNEDQANGDLSLEGLTVGLDFRF